MPVALAPPITIRPAPTLEPPYDEESTSAPVDRRAPVDQPSLPLDWTRGSGRQRPGALSLSTGSVRYAPPHGAPSRAELAARGLLVTGKTADHHFAGPRLAVGAGDGTVRAGGPGEDVRTATAVDTRLTHRGVHARWPDMTPAAGAVLHFMSLCLEVLNGYRPATHLRPLTLPAEFLSVHEQVIAALARVPRGPRRRTKVFLRDLRVCEPHPGVAEAAAVIGHDDRVWAMALRLERRPSGWLCTAVRVI